MAVWMTAAVLCSPGCERSKSDKAPAARRPPAARRAATTPPSMIHVGPGPLAPLIAAELRRAAPDMAIVLVYVGASWCEPCRHFKRAFEAGELDATLPDLRLIALDEDDDADRLAAAGYSGSMIPRFVVPGPDGRASGLRIEGSIKGPDAPAEILPRLRQLIASRR